MTQVPKVEPKEWSEAVWSNQAVIFVPINEPTEPLFDPLLILPEE